MAAAALAVNDSSAFNLPQMPMTRTTTSTHVKPPSHQVSPWLAAAPLTIAAFIFSFAPQPSLAVEGDITKGSQIFESSCAGCHRGGQVSKSILIYHAQKMHHVIHIIGHSYTL